MRVQLTNRSDDATRTHLSYRLKSPPRSPPGLGDPKQHLILARTCGLETIPSIDFEYDRLGIGNRARRWGNRRVKHWVGLLRLG